MPNLSQENSLYDESKPIKNTGIDHVPGRMESLYAKVNKNCSKRVKGRTTAKSASDSNFSYYTEDKTTAPFSLSLDRLDLSRDNTRPNVPPRMQGQQSVPSPPGAQYSAPLPQSPTAEAVEQSHVPKPTQSNNGAVIPTDSSCIIYEEQLVLSVLDG